MSHYKPYPAYKYSGVEWLGKVPADWQPTSLAYLATYLNGYPFAPEQWAADGVPIIRIAQLTGKPFDNFYDGVAPEHLQVVDGDLLFSWSATIDCFIWDRGPAWLNQHIFRVIPSREADKRFLYHLLRHVAPKLADFDAHGSTMRHIKKESLKERVFVPDLSTQKIIATHLDRETARIDALITKKTRFIELLREKRQALITHAVTKGLDPNVKMKDSGVTWLGRVPEHWSVRPLKSIVATPITDGPHETPNFLEEGVPFMSAEGVSGGFLNFEKIRGYISREDHERFSKKYKPQKHDIYMIKSGATTGITAIVDTEQEFNIWSPLAAIRCKDEISPFFVLNFMRSRSFQEAVALNWSFGTQQNIGMGVIGNLQITVPPLNEQQEIAFTIMNASNRVDALVQKTERSIELLKERRSALITAAVTGQIDLRQTMQTI